MVSLSVDLLHYLFEVLRHLLVQTLPAIGQALNHHFQIENLLLTFRFFGLRKDSLQPGNEDEGVEDIEVHELRQVLEDVENERLLEHVHAGLQLHQHTVDELIHSVLVFAREMSRHQGVKVLLLGNGDDALGYEGG